MDGWYRPTIMRRTSAHLRLHQARVVWVDGVPVYLGMLSTRVAEKL